MEDVGNGYGVAPPSPGFSAVVGAEKQALASTIELAEPERRGGEVEFQRRPIEQKRVDRLCGRRQRRRDFERDGKDLPATRCIDYLGPKRRDGCSQDEGRYEQHVNGRMPAHTLG